MPSMVHFPVSLSAKDQRAIARPTNLLHEFCGPISTLSVQGLDVHEQEMLTYALFKEQCDTAPGFRTRMHLQKKLPERWGLFTDYLDWSAGSLRLTRPPINHITESMGIAAALSVAESVFPVTNADFHRIKETPKSKTLDYMQSLVGSTGTKFVQIEAKGTHDGKSTTNQKRDVRLKKARRMKAMRADNRADMAFAGTVLDIRHERHAPTKITFCDPPGKTIEADPFTYRLLARLSYYWQQLRYITPSGQLTVAMANRMRALGAAPENWMSLTGVPLVGGSGEPISSPKHLGWTLRVTDAHGRMHSVFGAIIDLRLSREGISMWLTHRELPRMDHPLLFVGLDRKVLSPILKQDYELISTLSFGPSELVVAGNDASGTVFRSKSGIVCGRIYHEGWNEEHIEQMAVRLKRSI